MKSSNTCNRDLKDHRTDIAWYPGPSGREKWSGYLFICANYPRGSVHVHYCSKIDYVAVFQTSLICKSPVSKATCICMLYINMYIYVRSTQGYLPKYTGHS